MQTKDPQDEARATLLRMREQLVEAQRRQEAGLQARLALVRAEAAEARDLGVAPALVARRLSDLDREEAQCLADLERIRQDAAREEERERLRRYEEALASPPPAVAHPLVRRYVRTASADFSAVPLSAHEVEDARPGQPRPTGDRRWHGLIARELMSQDAAAPPGIEDSGLETCQHCRAPLRLANHASLLACTGCCRTYAYTDTTSSSMPYGTELKIAKSDYERRTHFKEWTTCFQALEPTKVPEEVLVQVCTELVRRRKTNPATLTPDDVQGVLEALHLSDHYRHLFQIFAEVTGRPPVRFTPEESNLLMSMFDLFLESFLKHKGPERKNMLSSHYCFVLFCTILGLHHYIPYCKIFKGPDKMKWHDEIAELCCRDFGWPFTALALLESLPK